MLAGSSIPRPSTGVESAPPCPLVGEPTPPSPKRVEVSHTQEQEGAPEPPRSGVEVDPITISDGSGGEVEASLVTKRTPWPIGLHSVEEQRKKEEEEREREMQQQPQEGLQQPQQQPQQEGDEGKGGGVKKELSSRSCWSRTGSRSCENSRSSSSKRISS